MNVTAEQVRAQLAVMGYRDVPDNIIAEFLEELKQKPEAADAPEPRPATAPAKARGSEPALAYPTAVDKQPRPQPSYDDDDDDDDDVRSDELAAAYERLGIKQPPTRPSRPSQSERPSTTGKQRKEHKELFDATRHHGDDDDVEAHWVLKGRPAERIPSSSARPRTPERSSRRHTFEDERPYRERERPFTANSRRSGAPSTIRASPRPPGFKKSDPVSMYAARAAEWKADPFLRRRSGTSRPQTADVRPATASGRRPQRNVWEGLPDYTPPTEKRRDGLRWEVRTQMMS